MADRAVKSFKNETDEGLLEATQKLSGQWSYSEQLWSKL